MLRNCQLSINKFINVYEGISPLLLATMSLGQGIKGATNIEMVESLKKSNIIQDQIILNSLKKVDRQWFTRQKDPYSNKPYSISRKQKMTDILTHSVILQNIYPHLMQLIKQKVQQSNSRQQNINISILDIGTGHGYLCFLIARIIEQSKLLNQSKLKVNVIGVDINKEAIFECENIFKGKFGNLDKRIQLNFETKDIQQLLQNNQNSYDSIIGGFYIQSELSNKLAQNLLGQNGFGIWATDSQAGQMLYKFIKSQHTNVKKIGIMNTLFTHRISRSKYDDYFIDGQNKNQQNNEQSETSFQSQKVKQMEQKQVLQKLRDQKKKKKLVVQSMLKKLLSDYKQKHGQVLSLQQMKEIPQILQLLIKLKKM